MSIYDNSEVDLAIQRVNLAIAQSDLRATNAKLAKINKSRTNYTSRNNQGKAFKPNGVTMPTQTSPFGTIASARSATASPRATERAGKPAMASARAMERMSPKSSPRATERANTKAKKKDTSWKTAGIWPALTSPEAKKFRDTFNKKGLLPALRSRGK
jgi:hypothetical protein